jgi:hypothetical protein
LDWGCAVKKLMLDTEVCLTPLELLGFELCVIVCYDPYWHSEREDNAFSELDSFFLSDVND